MKKLSFSFIFPLILLVLLVLALSNTIFIVPPLGKLLSPYKGFVQNENYENHKNEEIKLSSLKAKVSIFYDERSVPHIFAENDHDVFLTQGYVTAKDRLWQMDFISYAAAGRLSEILGNNYLEHDRLQRRMFILNSAKTTLSFIEKNAETKSALDAFTKGVNEYINTLTYKDYPFEYKLMDYKPEKWTNLKSVLIMKYVATMLTGYEEDISMAHMLQALGENKFRELFPEYSPIDLTLQKNKIIDVNNLPYKEYIDYSFLTNKGKVSASSYNPHYGSNNWALNGAKTSSGNPLLCNDLHLGLTLPSIWYEIQLNTPGMNVYGVSIPGTLGVIIGYNNKIAWGVTNGATDVRDWYKLKIRGNYEAYQMDGKWKKLKRHIERFYIKNQGTYIDTIYSSEHGPIVIDNKFEQNPDAKNFALKWTLHEPSNEFLTFLKLNKSSDYKSFKEAISYYQCPILNFAFASSSDTIAIHHQGLIAKKWNGQGRFLMDGTDSKHLYKEYLNSKEVPYEINPDRKFVYSANNFPAFSNYNSSNYINGHYTEDRSSEIYNILNNNGKFSISDMKTMQLSNKHFVASKVLPKLLTLVNTNNRKKTIYQQLYNWNYNFDQNSVAATFFDAWFKELEYLTWDELQIQDYYLRKPDHGVMVNLILNNPNSGYFDLISTDNIEDLYQLINLSFDNTLKKNKNEKWGDKNKINIKHLSQLPSLSLEHLSSGGNPDVINAISENWGPSWRMIVELGDRPKGFGIYVGGQSGNPGLKNYDAFIEDWRKGNYYEFNFFFSKNEAKAKCKYQTILTK